MRNNSVDAFRLIAAFSVVLLHVRYGSLPAVVVNNLRLLGRFGVPFFFMVSGFFFYRSYSSSGDRAFNKTLQRLLSIFMISNLVYGVLKFNRISFSYLIFFDGANLHLWFLSSLIFGMIICWYHYSFLRSTTLMLVVSLVIILLSLVSDAYSYLLPFKADANLSRYLLSVPYLFAGMLIAEKKVMLNRAMSFALVAGGILLQVAESIYLYRAHGYQPFDLQFMAGTIPFSIGMFFLSMNGFSNQALGELGRKYSLPVYIYHPLVNVFLFAAIRKLFAPYTGTIFMFSPLISFGATLLALMTIARYLPGVFSVLTGEFKFHRTASTQVAGK